MSDTPESLLTFPCDFPIKAMGREASTLRQQVLAILARHAPDFDPAQLKERQSGNGNYLALTAVIRAESKAQLDAIYLELTASDEVLMAL